MLKIFIVFSLLISFTVQTVFSGIVTLDPTFNGTGHRIQQIHQNGAGGNSVGILSNGKIVIGGSANGSFAAMLVNPNGSLDTGFDGDGIVITPVGSSTSGAGPVLVQPDNKILLGGYSSTPNTGSDITVVRYNTDGTLDSSFGVNGVAAPPLNSGDGLVDMALASDGKIAILGWVGSDRVVMRLNANGSLDSSFGGSGFVLTPTFQYPNDARFIVALPDGKIVIGGYLGNATFQYDEWLMMHFNSDGTSGGIVHIFAGGGPNTRIFAMDRQTDGKFIAGGNVRLGRFNSSGGLDSSFGSGGFAPTGCCVNELLALADGKILVRSWYTILRHNSNGAADTTFNGSGYITIPSIPGNDCSWGSFASQPDGKFILGANCTPTGGGVSKFALLRFRESKSPFDFDGDGKTDIGIFRPSNGQWWLNRSTGGVQTVTFGNSSDNITPGDFTGDGKTDIAIWRPSSGFWFVLRSEDFSSYSFPFGTTGDVPAPADYDGDGKADAAVFRPSTLTWYINKSTGGTTITTFGASGDVPTVADYDGDGKADIAIFRPSLGQWWIQRSSNNSVFATQFGNSTDKAVQGDYTGDGKADIAYWRPSNGFWFILRSEDFSFYAFPFGANGDVPVPGDYDGDGRFDAGVFRPSNSTWFANRSTAGTLIQQFGIAGDIPVPNAFVP